jgi:hypothetical protein
MTKLYFIVTLQEAFSSASQVLFDRSGVELVTCAAVGIALLVGCTRTNLIFSPSDAYHCHLRLTSYNFWVNFPPIF